MRERRLAGDLYIADDPEMPEQYLRAMDLMDAFNATSARDAGSVVTRDLPANVVAVGNPARVVRTIG
jgi:hypothetical protein